MLEVIVVRSELYEPLATHVRHHPDVVLRGEHEPDEGGNHMSSEAIRDPDVVLRGEHELVIQRPFGLVLENCRRMERDDLIVLDREVMARALEVRHLMREAISMHSEMHSEMLSGHGRA